MTQGAAQAKLPDPEKEAVEAAEVLSRPSEDDIFTTSVGVVLKFKPVPMDVLMRALARYERPKPPLIIDDNGAEFYNAADPDYAELVKSYEIKMAKMVQSVLILLGTEVVLPLPKGIKSDKANGWIDILETIGLLVERDNEHWRYLAWVGAVAAPSDVDILGIQKGVGRLSGISEDDVDTAVDFPESD